MSRIGENIRRLRLFQNKTQAELAAEVNVTAQAISKWERGAGIPDTSVLPMLCTALNTSIDTLMSYTPPANSETIFERLYAEGDDDFSLKPSELAYRVIHDFGSAEYPELIDIGCGNGRDAIFFARNGYSVTAFDIARSGIDRVYQYADYCHVPIKAFVADVITWRPETVYDIVYACKSLHYLSRESRQDIIEKYKQNTRPGGIHTIEVFVSKPFVERAPDQEKNVQLWRSGEIYSYYADWEILHMEEIIFDCNSSCVPHRHVSDSIIARKPR